jgi:hypothetical protein
MISTAWINSKIIDAYCQGVGNGFSRGLIAGSVVMFLLCSAV